MRFHIRATDEGVSGLEVDSVVELTVENTVRTFDQLNPNWHGDSITNELYLRGVHNHCYQLIQFRGHLFLNEVFDILGLSRTAGGQVLGWVKENEPGIIFEYDASKGNESIKTITFHPDGFILDQIESD